MIQDRPELIKYFASKGPLHLLIYVVPLWCFFSFQLAAHHPQLNLTLLGLLLGGIYWTFLEYFIHRFVYHTHYPIPFINYFIGSFHSYHHSNMKDHRILNAGFLMIYGLTPVVLAPFWPLVKDMAFLYAMALGLSLAYFGYECVHYLLHYKEYKTGYLGYIQRYHMYHHDHAPLKNFGNTSHLWDVIFGTYDKRYKDYQMGKRTEATLITKVSNHAEN